MGEAYIGLFLAAFGAATLLPLQSEAVLVGLLLSERHLVWLLLAVATLGNVLGLAGELGGWARGWSTSRIGAGFRSARPTWTRLACITNASVTGRCCSAGCRSSVIR